MQTCTPEWRTSFLREVDPALSKNVSVNIGVIGMHGKATETRKPVILTTYIKQKTHYQITFDDLVSIGKKAGHNMFNSELRSTCEALVVVPCGSPKKSPRTFI